MKGDLAGQVVAECNANMSRVTYDSVYRFIRYGRESNLVPTPRNRIEEEEEEEEEARALVSNEEKAALEDFGKKFVFFNCARRLSEKLCIKEANRYLAKVCPRRDFRPFFFCCCCCCQLFQ